VIPIGIHTTILDKLRERIHKESEESTLIYWEMEFTENCWVLDEFQETPLIASIFTRVKSSGQVFMELVFDSFRKPSLGVSAGKTRR
jgi:hypothetical protein